MHVIYLSLCVFQHFTKDSTRSRFLHTPTLHSRKLCAAGITSPVPFTDAKLLESVSCVVLASDLCLPAGTGLPMDTSWCEFTCAGFDSYCSSHHMCQTEGSKINSGCKEMTVLCGVYKLPVFFFLLIFAM